MKTLRHLIFLLALPLLLLTESQAALDAPTGQFQAANCIIDINGFLKCDGPLIALPGTSASSSSSASTSSTSTSSSSTSSTSSSSSSSGAPVYAFIVNNSAELATAMSSVAAGQTILLNDADYGNLTISKQWTNYVTLRAANRRQAVFNNITGSGATRGYVRFEDLSVRLFDFRNGAHHFQFTGNLVREMIYFNGATDLLVHNNEVRTYLTGTTGTTHSLLGNHIKNAVITHNYLSGATQDLMRLAGDVDNVVVRKNMFFNTVPNERKDLGPCEYDHTDALQGFGASGLNPRNLVIEGNLVYDDPNDNEVRSPECGGSRITMQGIFLSDPAGAGYVNVTVRNNMIYIGSPNTIMMNGGTSNVLIENNSLMGWNTAGGGNVRIFDRVPSIPSTGTIVRHNIVRTIADNSDAWNPTPGTNTTYTPETILSLFQLIGEGDNWQDFLPVPGSIAQNTGASAEVLAIQAGTSPPPGVLQ